MKDSLSYLTVRFLIPHRGFLAHHGQANAGEVLHSSSYRSPDALQPGHWLVVGGAFSGADVAAEMAAEMSVTVAMGEPLWFIPRSGWKTPEQWKRNLVV